MIAIVLGYGVMGCVNNTSDIYSVVGMVSLDVLIILMIAILLGGMML